MSSELAEVQELQLQREDQISVLTKVLEKNISEGFLEAAVTANTHHFADGIYVRAWYGSKGSVAVSAEHNESNVSILVSGHIRVVSTKQEEDVVEVYKDFAIFTTPPQTKRALYLLEDTIFITIHPNPTNTQDIVELEDRLAKEGAEKVLK